MKVIIFTVIFLLCELGTLVFFTAHGLVSWFSLILLVLAAKNVYVLYSEIKRRKQ